MFVKRPKASRFSKQVVICFIFGLNPHLSVLSGLLKYANLKCFQLNSQITIQIFPAVIVNSYVFNRQVATSSRQNNNNTTTSIWNGFQKNKEMEIIGVRRVAFQIMARE